MGNKCICPQIPSPTQTPAVTPTCSLRECDQTTISAIVPQKHLSVNLASPTPPTPTIQEHSTNSPLSPISPSEPQTPLEQYLSFSMPSTPIPSEHGTVSSGHSGGIKSEDAGFPSIPFSVATSNSKSGSKTESTHKTTSKPPPNTKYKKKRFHLSFKRKRKPKPVSTSNITPSTVQTGNGITGIYISSKQAQDLCIFWLCNVERLNENTKLEIACLIYFIMLQKCDQDFQSLFKNQNIKQRALHFLHMMSWLLMALNNDNIDLRSSLKKLGKLHKSYGVKLSFFQNYLTALHEALSEYFPNQYKIEIYHCMDQIFTTCARIMVGKIPPIKYKQCQNIAPMMNKLQKNGTANVTTPSSSFAGVSGLVDWNESRSLRSSKVWLTNLNSCLQSSIGREYFFRYLEQTACSEIVMFLQLYGEFKRCMSEKEKFMVSRKIVKTCIDVDGSSDFPINICYETKLNFLGNMKLLEDQWMLECKSPMFEEQTCLELSQDNTFVVPSDLLDPMLFEMKKLMMNNHWRRFCLQIQLMDKSPSPSVDRDNNVQCQ